MFLDKENFLKKEKIENKAAKFYRKVTLMESGAFKRISQWLILVNVMYLILFKDQHIYCIHFKLFILVVFEFVCIVLYRMNEYKFNKMLKNGIVLRTTIEHESRATVGGGFHAPLCIWSHYIESGGTRMEFYQSKPCYFNQKIFDIGSLAFIMERKLKKEKYVNVIVNPEKCSKYYMMFDEIGVEEKEKYEAPYSNKTENIILLIILLIEYIVWFLFIN